MESDFIKWRIVKRGRRTLEIGRTREDEGGQWQREEHGEK
jgi:hypothetical protein